MTYQPAVYRKQGGDELVVASSGKITVDSGGVIVNTPQSLGVADVATAITPSGNTILVGTTTGPAYTLDVGVAGYEKRIVMTASSSGVTHRAVIYAGSTGKTFGGVAGDKGNTLTLATSTCHSVSLVAGSSTAWYVVGIYPAVAPALTNKST